MISVDEARAAIAANALALPPEKVSLSEAAGRVLARDVRSDVDWPPFDTSAMDGYALRAAEAARSGGRLAERPGLVAAGDPPPPPLGPAETVRVMTGAPLPDGTDAVVPVEHSLREEGFVHFEIVPEPGAHIRRRGESVTSGCAVLHTGRRLTASDVALAALAGADPIEVFRRPRISIATTGNELVPAAGRPAAGQLRDSNGPMLFSACRALGWRATLLSAVRDEPESVEELFGARAEECDVLLTCGGVSAGDLDLLPDAAARVGFATVFARVAIRPGKPVVFGRREGTLWFGLPGNPVSASVVFHLFAREAIARLEGDREPGARRIQARLGRSLPPGGPREIYRDARWTVEEGESRADPVPSRGSHDLAAHARANALIRTAAHSPAQAEGALVDCVLL